MSKPGRLPDWEERLHRLLVQRTSAPYRPAHHDCLFWPIDAAKAVTGKDHGRGHRGKYKSTATGYRYLRHKLGHDSPEALLDSLFEQKPVGFAGRGDIVLCDLSAVEAPDSPPGPVPGVCMGAFALCIAAEHPESGAAQGLVRVPRGHWIKAWAVGEHHSGCGESLTASPFTPTGAESLSPGPPKPTGAGA